MYTKSLYLLSLCFIIISCSQKESQHSTAALTASVIPKPVSLNIKNDRMLLGDALTVVAKSDEEKRVAVLLQDFFKSRNIDASVTESSNSNNRFVLTTISDPALGKEGYKLSVGEAGIVLQANEGAGLFYGFQTLLQIVLENDRQIPFLEITDYPRFSYRGVHLDVGRHMFPADFIKKYIDLLAHHKFNRFHWHLTEDQGWRIEIKQYPKLQEIAAFRKETVIGHARTADRNEPKNFDGRRYGGYYTQEQIRDIVQYAADRYVTIIPEIELPGHSLAALSAYPELGCTGGPYEAATTWGVFEDVYCAGKEETFLFLQGVLDEVIALFPSEYIHIGGDESPKERWKKCPQCQKRIKAEGLKDEHELQSYFIQRIEKYINSKGRQIIGWDEILEGGLAPNATVMSWRGEEGGIAAAKQNHDVIMTPGNWCYFDHYQDTSNTEPLAIGGFTPVEEVYSYEPIPPQLSAEEAKHILGAQSNVWTEYIPNPEHAEYMVYPRACAMAEVVWSPKESRDYNDFLMRMSKHFQRLDEWKVNYAKHILKDVEKVSTSTP